MTRHRGGEVILEIQQVGAFLKVSAVDPSSLVEVSVLGPVGHGAELLQRTALRKLDYVLAKRAGGTPPRA